MIDEAPQLDPVTERVAVNVLRHLEWQSKGFSLVFIFADVGPALSLASWLDQRLIGRGTPLERRDTPSDFVACPQALVDEIVGSHPNTEEAKGALWQWLHLHPSDQQWNVARRTFLARMNERRFLLERDLGRPLVLVMPFSFKSDARSIAPDLWAIRALSEELRTPWRAGIVAHGNSSLPALTSSGVGWVGEPPSAAVATPPTSAEAALRAYDEWRSVFSSAPDRAYLATAWAAVDELMQVGRPADAMVVAKQAAELARQRVQQSHAEGAGLRDASISLDNVARVAQVQGNWTEAEALYRESLAIRRHLVERLGGSPEALRDVAISLDNVARVAQVQGNLTDADTLFRESLAIARQLLERLAGTREALRDVAVSSDNVAGVAQAQGNWTEAESLYREGLAISRQLLERPGRTPEALRDVSVSLNSVARVAQAQGNWTEAESLYREGLAITRQVLERLGDDPEALRDVSVSLNNVARMAQAQGNWAEAELLFRESLAIRRQLLERLGGTPEALDDVGVSLVNLSTLQNEPDKSRLEEALEIYERLVSNFPSVAEYGRRLAGVRKLLGK